MPERITGGYILKARCIKDGYIAHAPPHVREIWDYLLRTANHCDRGKIKRGQLYTTYNDIQEALSWNVGYRTERYKKHHCDTAMKALTKERMIQTTRTTRGMIITINNYDTYQNPKNYDTDGDTTTIPTRYRRDNDYDTQECKNEIVVMSVPLKNGGQFDITEADVAQWKESYQYADIDYQLKKMRQWNIDNPAKQKTAAGIRRHINTWLATANDKVKPQESDWS